MGRKLTAVASAFALATIGVVFASAGSASAAPIPLVLSQSAAFGVLGYWCGGIQEQAYATQFEPASGYPDGEVLLKTTCSAGGKGGHSFTVTAWAGATWDFTGALVSDTKLASAPAVDPNLTAFDSHGNEIYNASNSAYLALATGFVPAPRLTGMSPTFGPASGGTTVSLTGTGFTGVTAVDFGTTPAATFTVTSGTSVTAVSPAAPAGTVDVTVTTAGGPDATSPIDQFTFYAQPSVTSLSPNSGPVNGGTSVDVTGTGFLGASAVKFGDTPTGFVVNSDTSLTAFSPGEGNPDTVDVTVTTPGGASTTTPLDVFSYTSISSGTPGAPTGVGAVAGDSTATVSFTAPATDGGSPITSYTVLATDTSNPANGGQSASGSSSPLTVTSLVNGDTYTFTVAADNVNGPGSSSATSNSVVPVSFALPAFQIATPSLPDATRGAPYRVTLQALGGARPYRWKALGGLPPGFRLRPNGVLSGKPTVRRTPPGLYALTIEVRTKPSKTSPVQTTTQVLTLSIG